MVAKSASETTDFGYTRILKTADYQFNQCLVHMGVVHELSGNLKLSEDSASGSRLSAFGASVKWVGFTWRQPNGTSTIIDANSRVNEQIDFDTRSLLEVSINRFESVSGEQILEQITDSNFRLLDESYAEGSVHAYTLHASGSVLDGCGVSITIDTDPDMNRRLVSGRFADEAAPFSGQIIISADNGAELIYNATTVTGTTSLHVNVNYLDGEGGSKELGTQEFVNLPVVLR